MTGSQLSDHEERDDPEVHLPSSKFSSYGDEPGSPELPVAPAEDPNAIQPTPSSLSVDPTLARAPVSGYPYQRFDGGLDSRPDLGLGDKERFSRKYMPPFTPERRSTTNHGPSEHQRYPISLPHSTQEAQEATNTDAKDRPSTSHDPLPHAHLHTETEGATKTTTKNQPLTYTPTGSPEKVAEELERRNASAVARFRRFVNSERREQDLKHVFMSKGYNRKAASLLASYEIMRLKELVG